ncbi:MAG TPA: methyltransferase domain-containing protein [Patescibacteria group bacterium]|jgi:magnesium-protoporphyrin O-methyltransferase|nr:methyltransferase domain-containing protein [Patescibacteria group bacterium]
MVDACGCDGGFEIFDEKSAEEDLQRYRGHGPDATTATLVDMIRERGVSGSSLLDIGGGIGVIDHELLRAGAGHAVLVDASGPAVEMARREARRRGTLDRLEFVDGDFVSRASDVDVADIVTLDRVICCYPDVESLVRLSATRARSLYGLVLPRDRRLLRWALPLLNAWFRVRGFRYRTFLHANAKVDALVAAAGLRQVRESRTFMWRVVLYERLGPA